MGRGVAYPNLPEGFVQDAIKTRNRWGMSIKNLAKDVGCSASTISHVETGRHNVSYEMAQKINDVLDLGYDLPLPDKVDCDILRKPFLAEIDGRIFEVRLYRDLGPVEEVIPKGRVIKSQPRSGG